MRPRDIQDVWRNQLDAASTRTTRFDSAKLYEPGTKVDSVVIDKPTKLKFPRFNRAQIQEWLVQVEQYFDSENTPEKYKVWLVSIHLDDVAKKWNRSLWHSVNDWETYRICLQEQFDISVAELHRLRETAGILAYHEQFELISARLSLPEDYLVQAYLNGLSLDTQRAVEQFQPRTVKECRCFGRLHEILYSKNPTSYYAQSSKVSNATIEGAIVTMEDAGSVAAAEEVMGIEDKPVDILEEAESFSLVVEVTEFGDKHIHLSAEAEVYQSQEVGQQNTEQSDVIVEASNSEEKINQSCKARLNDFELLQTKDSSEHVLHIQGIDVASATVLAKQTTVTIANDPLVSSFMLHGYFYFASATFSAQIQNTTLHHSKIWPLVVRLLNLMGSNSLVSSSKKTKLCKNWWFKYKESTMARAYKGSILLLYSENVDMRVYFSVWPCWKKKKSANILLKRNLKAKILCVKLNGQRLMLCKGRYMVINWFDLEKLPKGKSFKHYITDNEKMSPKMGRNEELVTKEYSVNSHRHLSSCTFMDKQHSCSLLQDNQLWDPGGVFSLQQKLWVESIFQPALHRYYVDALQLTLRHSMTVVFITVHMIIWYTKNQFNDAV